MRKIVAGLFMSLDGVVEAPAEWGFKYITDEMTKGMLAGIAQADTVLLGRRTYLDFAQLWPGQSSAVPMASFLNNSPKVVVSATLDLPLPWGPATLIRSNHVQALTTLKEAPGQNIQIPGSPTLVRSLLDEGLLDELSLSICPVVVGPGLRLFEGVLQSVSLKVVHATVLSNGVIGVTYRPAQAADKVPEAPINFPDAAARHRDAW
jgi:dihydrofolate reductase